jgi:lysyl-tRNA synthetase class 1
MRWLALGVDYEMAGKDLIDSVTQSSKIARLLGAKPPEGFNYEMFLDERGEKISKSKGNGLSLEQWLTYGPPESLAYFAYREPKRAKQLHLGVIPRAIEDHAKSVADYLNQTDAQRLANPVHHLPFSRPEGTPPVSFGLLLNLAGLPGVGTPETMWGFLKRYDPALSPEANPELDRLVGYAAAYARDFITPTLQRRSPTPEEAEALRALDQALADDRPEPGDEAAVRLQGHVYEVGKRFYGKERLRDWFGALYQTLLGSDQGPRMGSFISLYGIENTRALISDALNRA